MPPRIAIATRLIVLLVLGGIPSAAASPSHQRILILHSFGSGFEPFATFATALRAELEQRSEGEIEVFVAALEATRLPTTSVEGPLADYLEALFRDSGIDLVLSIGGAAARFCLEQRERLFPATPLLMTAFERRLADLPLPPMTAALPVELDFSAAIQGLLDLLPGITDVAVVLGSSSIEEYWVDEVRRELLPFGDRLRFTWLDDLPVREMSARVATLPEHSAVFYALLAVDGAGIPNEGDRALLQLHAASRAPIFGLFDSQMGRGIVGGALVPISANGRRAADAALRILAGEDPARIDVEPAAAAPVYDFRELERWGIPADRLPPGSTILHRPPSVWARHRLILIAGTLVVLETALIAGLLFEGARRRRLEREGRELARRLLIAHEEERRRLALDLHDDLSQRLARLAIDSAQVQRHLAGTDAEASAEALRRDLASLADDVHALSYRLHPSILEDLGLEHALEVECDQFSRRESVPAELTANRAPTDLPKASALCLFRIAQEALRNAARHAGASRIEVALAERRGGVELTVSDDGAGFDTGSSRARPSLGRASMTERALAVGGRLTIESSPGRGTTVRAWVPSTRVAG